MVGPAKCGQEGETGSWSWQGCGICQAECGQEERQVWQTGWWGWGGVTPEALLCPTEVAVCGGRFRDAEAAQM